MPMKRIQSGASIPPKPMIHNFFAYSPYFHTIIINSLSISAKFINFPLFLINLRFLLPSILNMMHLCIMLYMYWMPLHRIAHVNSLSTFSASSCAVGPSHYEMKNWCLLSTHLRCHGASGNQEHTPSDKEWLYVTPSSNLTSSSSTISMTTFHVTSYFHMPLLSCNLSRQVTSYLATSNVHLMSSPCLAYSYSQAAETGKVFVKNCSSKQEL